MRSISHDGGSFLWIPNLGLPDPWKVLPIAAGVFQFIQTKMMRPAGGVKAADPQQQMMNTMMNFMPLMVVFFGWNFAAGAVLYWATQSVYSVVQQWFITGWGSMKNWFPFLPELPEHRRLGHRKPVERIDVGEYQPKGVMGMLQRRMQDAGDRQRTAAETRGKPSEAAPATKSKQEAKGDGGASNGTAATAPVDPTSSRVMTGRTRASSGSDNSSS